MITSSPLILPHQVWSRHVRRHHIIRSWWKLSHYGLLLLQDYTKCYPITIIDVSFSTPVLTYVSIVHHFDSRIRSISLLKDWFTYQYFILKFTNRCFLFILASSWYQFRRHYLWYKFSQYGLLLLQDFIACCPPLSSIFPSWTRSSWCIVVVDDDKYSVTTGFEKEIILLTISSSNLYCRIFLCYKFSHYGFLLLHPRDQVGYTIVVVVLADDSGNMLPYRSIPSTIDHPPTNRLNISLVQPSSINLHRYLTREGSILPTISPIQIPFNIIFFMINIKFDIPSLVALPFGLLLLQDYKFRRHRHITQSRLLFLYQIDYWRRP